MRKKIEMDCSLNRYIENKTNGNQNILVVFLNGNKMKTLKSLYDELKVKFSLPEYFGENWDAVEDCLTDLEWISEKQYIIVITNYEKILNEYEYNYDKNEELQIFEQVLIDCIKFWHTPFRPDEVFGHNYRDFDVYIQENGEIYQLLSE